MADRKVYLLTGATRGIGAGMLKELLARDAKPIVIATVRNFDSESAQKLVEQAKTTKELVVVKLDSTKGGESDAQEAARVVQSQYNIDYIDVILANAGIASDFDPLIHVTLDNLRISMEVNLYAPVSLFQAFEPLLKKSSKPQILFMSTAIASKGLQRMLPYTASTYGSAKTALNFIALRLAIEHPNITSFAVHPGLVQTDMGSTAQNSLGVNIADSVAEGAAVTVEQSASAVLSLSDKADANYSGKFYHAIQGTELPW